MWLSREGKQMTKSNCPSFKRPLRGCLARARAGLLLLALTAGTAHAGVVVIGHASLAKVDKLVLQKIFTGRLVEYEGMPLIAINASSGSSVRERFLQTYLSQDEEKYTAYWTVRRYVGKGAPPKEFASSAEVIAFVSSTLGAVGYIEESEIKPGLNILLRK